MGFLHLPAPEHSSASTPGLLCSPHTESHITADLPVLLGRPPHPTEVVQVQSRAALTQELNEACL
jgi:hypothetical protein